MGHLPSPPQKSGKIFLGKYEVKFGNFVNFSGKYHVKFEHFVNLEFLRHNFIKCWPILEILSESQSAGNSQ